MSKSISVQEAGRKGGRARAAKLSRERRSEIARKGYLASPLSTKRANQPKPDEMSQNKV